MLAIGRYFDGHKAIGVFNFTGWEKRITLPHDQGEFMDMLTGTPHILQDLAVPPCGFYYLEQVQMP